MKTCKTCGKLIPFNEGFYFSAEYINNCKVKRECHHYSCVSVNINNAEINTLPKSVRVDNVQDQFERYSLQCNR